MKKIFLDAPLYIKIFASAFVTLSCFGIGAFYYVGNKVQKAYDTDLLQVHKAQEVVNAKSRQLSSLRRQIVP